MPACAPSTIYYVNLCSLGCAVFAAVFQFMSVNNILLVAMYQHPRTLYARGPMLWQV